MKRRAFTLVELLVVIAIIGLLSTVASVALSSSRVNARNTKRKADLVQISKALELYYSDNGTYPLTGGSGNWHGNCSGYGSYPDAYVDPTHDAWIPGLTPTYMATLPRDPTSGKNNQLGANANCNSDTRACYIYTATLTDYKLMAFCTPEGAVPTSDPFSDPNFYIPSAYSIYTSGARNW